MEKRIQVILTVIAATTLGQTSVNLISAPNGTATAGQVAGYSMNGVYGSDGTLINFKTTLTFPIAQAVNGTVIQTYL